MNRGTFDLLSGEWSDGRPRDPYPWNHRHRPKHRKDRPAETVNQFGEGSRAPLRPAEHLPLPTLPGSPIGLEPDPYPYSTAYAEAKSRGPGSV